MTWLAHALGWAADRGRILLVLGLVVGAAVPEFAFLMRSFLPELVAGVLFIAALRVGPRQALGAVSEQKKSLVFVAMLQLALPICVVALFRLAGFSGTLPLVLILMVSAAPISGAPALCVMVGHDPAPALRQLVVGTALLPLTVVPVFWFVPELGDIGTVFAAAGRLLLTIGVSTGLAFLVRSIVIPRPGPATLKAIDGVSAIAMAIIVIGLMSAVGPAIWSDPKALLFYLFAAFAANFGLQITAWFLTGKSSWSEYATPIGISAGNRNIALFLTALPAATTDPLLLFIGCYQIPMYLTPVLLGRMYASRN